MFVRQVPTAGNLTGHGLVIALLHLGLGPTTAEKVLVSLAIVGLALSFRFVVSGLKNTPPEAALLVSPFLDNWPLQMGFWSFSLGIPFLLVCTGLASRFAGRWNAPRILLLFAAACLVYACHPICWASAGFAVTCIALGYAGRSLWSRSTRREAVVQIALPVLAFVPSAVPNFLFAADSHPVLWYWPRNIAALFWPIYAVEPLRLFAGDHLQARLVFFLFLSTSILVVISRFRYREVNAADALLVITAGFFCLGLVCPSRIGEGTYLSDRFILFGYLFWALWISATLARTRFVILVPVTVALTLWLVLARLPAWDHYNRQMKTFVAMSQVIPPNSTICQLDYSDPELPVSPMEHAVDLIVDRPEIDVRDYEAGRKAFWTRFRPGFFLDESYLSPSSTKDLEGAVQRFSHRTGLPVQYIVLSDLQSLPDATLKHVLPTLWRDYRLVSSGAGTAIFERRVLQS